MAESFKDRKVSVTGVPTPSHTTGWVPPSQVMVFASPSARCLPLGCTQTVSMCGNRTSITNTAELKSIPCVERNALAGSSGHDAASGAMGRLERVGWALLHLKSEHGVVSVGHWEKVLLCTGELEQ